MQRRIHQALLIGALGSAALLSACGASNSPAPFGGGKSGKGPTAEEAMAGASTEVQALYKSNCLSCHASNLEGKMGDSTNLQKIGARKTQEQIAKQITEGGGGMPAFKGKLNAGETDALAAWLAGKK